MRDSETFENHFRGALGTQRVPFAPSIVSRETETFETSGATR